MLIDKSCEFLFNVPSAKKWLMRPRFPRGNALFPLTYDPKPNGDPRDSYAMSDSIEAFRLTETLARRFTDEFPTDVTSSGYAGPSGVPGDFYSLLNVSGHGMDPLPIPIADNAALVKSAGLESKLLEADRPWFKETCRLFFGAHEATPLRLKKGGSTSFPYFTTDIQYRKLAALKCLREPDRFLELATGGPQHLTALLNEYGVLILYAIHERQQPNAILFKDGRFSSKPRTTPTEEEARTGSYTGKTVANMAVFDAHGNEVPNHFAMRRRDVFGLNGPVNYFLSAIFSSFRAVYETRFEATFKARGRDDKLARALPYKYAVGSDVKTMDKLIPRWFLDELCAELVTYLDERVIELFRRCFQAPYVVPPPWRDTPDSYNPVFGGSPLDPSHFVQFVGLPSGIAPNPLIGKLWMAFNYILLMRDSGGLAAPSEIEGFLQHRNPLCALQDMADDAVLLTNSEQIATRLRNPKGRYVLLEVEVPPVFLGDVYCQTPSGLQVYPNPITYVQNVLCRETSIHRDGPVAWATGTLARQQIYAASPVYRDLNAIYLEECRRHFGVNPSLLASALGKHERLSEADALVRANPDVIHYKVDPEDVSPEVLDDVVATVPAADFYSYIKPLFKSRHS